MQWVFPCLTSFNSYCEVAGIDIYIQLCSPSVILWINLCSDIIMSLLNGYLLVHQVWFSIEFHKVVGIKAPSHSEICFWYWSVGKPITSGPWALHKPSTLSLSYLAIPMRWQCVSLGRPWWVGWAGHVETHIPAGSLLVLAWTVSIPTGNSNRPPLPVHSSPQEQPATTMLIKAFLFTGAQLTADTPWLISPFQEWIRHVSRPHSGGVFWRIQ